MIDVHIPAGHLQERVYALHILLYDYLGLTYSITVDPDIDHYKLLYQRKEIIIADAFFGRFTSPLGYLRAENIPDQVGYAQSPELHNCIIIYGKDRFSERNGSISCGVDLIASAFFMLTRWEEFASDVRDEHERFPGSASLAHRAHFLNRPVVCEYVALLREWLMSIGVATGFKRHEYRLVFTVDVDHPWYWDKPLSYIQKALGEGVRARSWRRFISGLKAHQESRDPWMTYDLLMDLAETKQAKAHFFLMAGGTHKLDPGSKTGDARLAAIVEHIHERGHTLGIHPSYLTSADSRLFQEEMRIFSEHYSKGVLTGRQHYLRLNVPYTWRSWEKGGWAWDSSLGYADEPGFRCGTCWPFPLFDILSRRMLGVLERPLLLMDITLRMYKDFSPDEAITTAVAIKTQVAKHDGEFVVLWHNSSFFTDTWSDYEVVLSKAFT